MQVAVFSIKGTSSLTPGDVLTLPQTAIGSSTPYKGIIHSAGSMFNPLVSTAECHADHACDVTSELSLS